MRVQQTTTTSTTPSPYTSGTPGRNTWPDAVAYREAIQTPNIALTDPMLQHARVVLDRRELPVTYAGRFAVVFKLRTTNGETWALRCFTSQGDAEGAWRAARYELVQQYVNSERSIFVPFRYISDGIRIAGRTYPIMTMRWASGDPLGRWVETHLYSPDVLRTLCGTLTALLSRLEEKGVSHGDWQHDNLLVSEDGKHVTLVDYDGLYLPEFAGQSAPELGHSNYQHPARTASHYGPGLDRFACLVIQTALLALAHDPGLWSRFSDGESLLFKKSDFVDPAHSPVFEEIKRIAVERQDEMLAEAIVRLEDACHAGAMSTLLPVVEATAGAQAASPVYEPIKVVPVDSSAAINSTRPENIVSAMNNVAGMQRWWLLPETTQPTATTTSSVTSTSGAAIGRASVLASLGAAIPSRPRTYSASAVQPPPFSFILRTQDIESLKTERKHLWAWRAGGASMVGFILMLVYFAIQTRNPVLPIYFAWLLNYAGLGYSKWPRKVIYEELVAQIAKIEELIEGRNRQIREKGGAGYSAAVASGTTLPEFITGQLRKTSINKVLIVAGIQVSTTRQLRTEGIETALDLQRRVHGSRLPPHQITALQNWINELETQFAADWRKMVGPSRSIPTDIVRLQQEVAEFERHLAHLKREHSQFPDTSFQTYLSLLLGMDQARPGAGTPASGTP